MDKKIMDQITRASLDLRLAAFRNDLESIVTQAVKETASYEQVILNLLKAEQEVRLINRKKVQMRNAAFPQLKYLQDISRPDLPADAAAKLPELETLDFVTAGSNVILGGSPGTGKTHIAIGLGIKACQQGYNVMFTTVSKLLTQIRESHSNRTLRSLELKFEKYDFSHLR